MTSCSGFNLPLCIILHTLKSNTEWHDYLISSLTNNESFWKKLRDITFQILKTRWLQLEGIHNKYLGSTRGPLTSPSPYRGATLTMISHDNSLGRWISNWSAGGLKLKETWGKTDTPQTAKLLRFEAYWRLLENLSWFYYITEMS